MVAEGEVGGSPSLFALMLGAATIVLLIAYIFLRMSARLSRLLGQTGINVVTRVLGLILAALAVQYVADGLGGLDLFPS
jgi:multiple antibiotic resistance protein